MKILLEDYKRKLKTVTELIEKTRSNGSIVHERREERFNTKAAEYRTFIVEIERAIARASNENSGLVRDSIRQRILGWWETLPETLNGENSKYQLAYKYYDRHWMSLTYREIEKIYGAYVI